MLHHVLLEQNGAETGVEGTDTLVLQDLAEATDEAVGKGGLRDETDTGGLERAEGDISEELAEGRGDEVDSGAVVRGSLVAEHVDALLLEELVSTELEGALEEVAGSRGTEASQESTTTLVGDDLPHATEQALVVGYGVELDPRLDAATCQLGARQRTARPRRASASEPLAIAMRTKPQGKRTHRRV
jgi:hypothetical protein